MNAVRGLLVRIRDGSLLTKRLSCILLLFAITWPQLHTMTANSPHQNDCCASRPLDNELYLHPFLNQRLHCTITNSIRHILDSQEECDIEAYDTASLSGMLRQLQKLDMCIQHLNTTIGERAMPSQPSEVDFDDLAYLKAIALAVDDFRVLLGDTSHEVKTWMAAHNLEQARTSVCARLKNKHLWNGVESIYLLASTWPWRATSVVPIEDVEKARHMEKCSSFLGQTGWHLQSLTRYLAIEFVLVGEVVQVLDGVLSLPDVLGGYRDRRCEDVCKILIVSGLAALNSTLGRNP